MSFALLIFSEEDGSGRYHLPLRAKWNLAKSENFIWQTLFIKVMFGQTSFDQRTNQQS
jgi:hypothetical protein